MFRQAQHKSWAISPVWACGWLPAPLPESVKRVTLFRLSISRDFRTVLRLRPGLVASERPSALCLIDLETAPFWASLPSGFGWFCMTTPQYTFSCLIHVYPFMGIVACPASSVVRFDFTGFSSRFRPAFTRRTPREGAVSRSPGRQGLPRRRSAGLLRYRLLCGIIDLFGPTAVTKVNDLRRPSPAFTGSFGQTGRTQSVQRTGGILRDL